jgi:hypothetical protein
VGSLFVILAAHSGVAVGAAALDMTGPSTCNVKWARVDGDDRALALASGQTQHFHVGWLTHLLSTIGKRQGVNSKPVWVLNVLVCPIRRAGDFGLPL